MDHLPSFNSSSHSKVPCLDPKGFDGDEFEEYPNRHGWDLPALFQGDLRGRTPEEAAAFLQSWMYFGTLFETFSPVFGETYDQQAFVEESESGSFFVSTKELGPHILEWHSREAVADSTVKERRFKRMQRCFKSLIILVDRFCRCQEATHIAEPNKSPLHPLIALSIIVLADTLTYAGFQITGLRFDIDWGGSEFLIKRMRDSGWCPRAIQTLRRGQQIHNLYYASTLGPPMDTRNHSTCTNLVCEAEQVKLSTYKPQHRPDCTGCTFVLVPEQNLVQILENNGLPIVSCRIVEDQTRLEITNGTALSVSPDYVAISHIWADGLGNHNQNALPTCQVNHIQHLVDKLAAKDGISVRHWWCDTLCVPVREEYQHLRKKAIREMRATYKNATSVLVIDRGLMQISKEEGTIELYIRLKLSSWMSRLWTLHEGVLGREVYIQFSDGSRLLQDIGNGIVEEEAQCGRNLYRRYGFLSRPFFGVFGNSPDSDSLQKFPDLWRALQYRSTSYQEDETICLANMLALDPIDLLELPRNDHEGRIAKLLQMIRILPLNMIWQPPPRLSIPGLTWAPRSFMNCFRGTRTNPFRVIQGTGEMDPSGRGLHFKRAGFKIEQDHSQPILPIIGSEVVWQAIPQKDTCIAFRVSPVYEGDRGASTFDKLSASREAVLITESAFHGGVNSIAAIFATVRASTHQAGLGLVVDFVTIVQLQITKVFQTLPPEGSSQFFAQKLSADQSWLMY